MASIPVIHLHGKLGELPELGPGGRPYCDTTADHPGFLQTAIQGIRIVSEPIDDDSVFARAHAALKEAENVIFLGFGYLPDNVRRLRLDQHRNPSTRYYGTGVDLRPAERNRNVLPLFPDVGPGSPLKPIAIPDAEWDVLEFLRNNIFLLR